MSYEFRDSRNYFYGTLTNAAAVSDVTLTSTAFPVLGTAYSSATPGTYLPLELHDPSTGLVEVVWVVGHSASSQQVTVIRGREGTTALAWNAGTQVVCAPTATRDTLAVATSTTLPTDPNIGLRLALTDKKYVAERVNGGWAPSVGLAVASDLGVNMNSVVVPDGATTVIRSSQFSGTTNASGDLVCSYKTPFPNNTLFVGVFSTDYGAIGPYVIYQQTASNFGVTVFNGSATRKTNFATSFIYLAVGW